MLTEFNEGGSHSSNPNGGIPIGTNPNGKQNTVEQGETKKDNFIYSDKLYINEDLAKQMNLPGYIKGKSFAKASKAINDKFKDRNDIHTNATKKELLDRLAQSQEHLKAQQEAINKSMSINQSQIEYPEQIEKFEGGGFMDFIKDNGSSIGNLSGQIGGMLNYRGYNGEDIDKANNEGFDNKHLKDSGKYNQALDMVEGSIAKSFGPIGESVFGAKKLGEGIGTAIGGDAGAGIKSLFSPEKSAITNWTDKDMKFGDKLLGSLPVISGIKAKNSADKKLTKFNDDKRRADNFFKYQFNENNNDTITFEEGGLLNDPNKMIDPTKKITVNQLINEKIGDSTGRSTSKYLDIVGMQKGINHPKKGSGAYFYSGKTPNDEGYDPVINREFIQNDAIQNYLNSEQGKKYQQALKAQIDMETKSGLPISSYSYLNPNKTQFAYGGELPKVTKRDYSIDNEALKEDLILDNDLISKPFDSDKFFNYKKSDNNIETDKSNKFFDKDNLSNIGNNLLKYSPVISNILQKSKMKPAEVESAIKNPYQYNKQYIDERTDQNIAEQTAAGTMEALNKSGLSGNQLLAASLGSQLNRTKYISEAAKQNRLYNINENKIAEQVKQQNETDFIADKRRINDVNAQNRANYDTQRSKFDSAIGTSLGEIGKEEIFKKMAEKMTGYDWMGKFLKDNPNATPEDVDKAYKSEKEKSSTYKYGGLMKLKFKKY